MKEWIPALNADAAGNLEQTPLDFVNDERNYIFVCPYCYSYQEKRTQFCPECGKRCAFVSIEKPPSD